jgi:hypothetical protein
VSKSELNIRELTVNALITKPGMISALALGRKLYPLLPFTPD